MRRQPVHVVYGGADKFIYNIPDKLGKIALKTIDEYANYPAAFFNALGITDYTYSQKVFEKVQEKLLKEPVEDYRVDFEDGYGIRTEEEEDKSAEITAVETARGFKENTLPPFFGIRIKPLTEEFKKRAYKTLDIFFSNLLSETNGRLPDNFLITLPKISSPGQIASFVRKLAQLEKKYSLPEGSLKFEMMVETPQIIINEKGHYGLPELIPASEGRCFSAHFGAYDFTSSLDITAKNQSLSHPVCDLVRNIMKISFAGSGIFLSDGATNTLPVPAFRGDNLTEEQKEYNRKLIFSAWRTSYNDINHSLKMGFYQGWDLHPAQLPVRYAAVYLFFIEELESASKRLKGLMDKERQVSLSGNIFDDAASAQGLANFFARGINCGAITNEELKKTGLFAEGMKIKSI